MNIFNHFKHINLTDDQNNALEGIQAFIESDQQVFILQGYAGTGKTTILKGVRNYILGKNQSCKLLAPTGRAAMVLAEKTEFEATTIHRAIYNMNSLIEKESISSFKYSYGIKANQEPSDCVYIVDEASMVSDVFSEDEFFTFGTGFLLSDLINYVRQGDNRRKLVFVGDNAQLPPIGMNTSPALDDIYINNKYELTSVIATLTQVVRQAKESGILSSATKLRQSLTENVFNHFKIDFDKSDIQNINSESFLENYVCAAKSVGVENTIVVAHANSQALMYNQEIRRLRFGDKYERLQKQDRLLITKNNYNGEIELFNGQFAQVIAVGEISYTKDVRFIIEGGKKISRNLRFRNVVVEVESSEGKNKPFKTTILDDFLTSEEGRLHPYDQRALFIDFKDRMGKSGIKPGMKSFKDKLKSDIFFNALQVKYGYAITCHKSQGGEWKSVFVDFNTFIGKKTSSFYRWAYTSITRSSRMLYCISAPQFDVLSSFYIAEMVKLSEPSYEMFFNFESEINFVESRKEKLTSSCANLGIELSMNDKQNQIECTFIKNIELVKLQLWYKNKGFSKTIYQNSTSDEFKNCIHDVLVSTLIPNEVPFKEKFAFQKELHGFIINILEEENAPITNIVQMEWSDRYFFYTGAECACIEFCYDKKQCYTYAKPMSTLGSSDEKLNLILNRLKS